MEKSILRRSKGPEILIALLDGPKHVLEVHRVVGGSLGIVEAILNQLIKQELATANVVTTTWPYKKVFHLTPEGKRVAEVVKRMYFALTDASSLGRKKWVLHLLNRFGKIEGTTRMEKLLFKLKKSTGIPLGLDAYTFVKWKHGPYSSELAYDLNRLELAGLIEVREEVVGYNEKGEDIVRRTYTLTERGKDIAEKLRAELPPEHWKKLSILEPDVNKPLPILLKEIRPLYANKKDGEEV